MSFVRMLKNGAIEALRNEQLFIQHLKQDCENGDVFLAVRNNYVDFYHKGGRLFSWKKTNGFSTHYKYASVLVSERKDYFLDSELQKTKDYLSESELQNTRLIKDFCEGYTRIKENCARYSKCEAMGVASLYHRFPYVARKEHDVVVLDIEIAFSSAQDDTQSDDAQSNERIDFVTLDFTSKKLSFFEAKHYSNRLDLRSNDKCPALCAQLERYDSQLQKQGAEILDAYKTYVSILNELFDLKIPQPVDMDPITKAIIFGFDVEQRAYLNKNIVTSENGLRDRTYSIGEIKDADLSAMLRRNKQNWE